MPVVARALREFARVNLEGLDVNHQLGLGLVGGVFPLALRRNHHAHAVAHLGGGNGLHGRAKVVDIQAPAQALGQAHVAQFHHQGAAHLFDIRCHFAAGQRQAHPAGALACAPKINGAQRRLGAALRHHAVGRGLRSARAGGGLQRHQQGAVGHLQGVRRRALEAEHHAAALVGLHHVGRLHIGLIDVYRRAPHAARNASKVQRNARRALGHKSGWQGGQWLGKFDSHRLHVALRRTGNGDDGILGPGAQPRAHQAASQDRPKDRRRRPHCCCHLDISCNFKMVLRTDHSPKSSCTISRTVMRVSSTWVTLPMFWPR